ncbi:MAG: hypothetical protein PHY33_04665 [Methanobacteriaceae archaeon]|nr:hypothetical protein [Methanobacteriaceae archaeon]
MKKINKSDLGKNKELNNEIENIPPFSQEEAIKRLIDSEPHLNLEDKEILEQDLKHLIENYSEEDELKQLIEDHFKENYPEYDNYDESEDLLRKINDIIYYSKPSKDFYNETDEEEYTDYPDENSNFLLKKKPPLDEVNIFDATEQFKEDLLDLEINFEDDAPQTTYTEELEDLADKFCSDFETEIDNLIKSEPKEDLNDLIKNDPNFNLDERDISKEELKSILEHEDLSIDFDYEDALDQIFYTSKEMKISNNFYIQNEDNTLSMNYISDWDDEEDNLDFPEENTCFYLRKNEDSDSNPDFNLDTCQEDFFDEMCEDIDFDLMYAINNSDEGFIDLILTLSELDEESDNMDLNFSEEEEIKDLIKKEPSWDVKIKNRVIL